MSSNLIAIGREQMLFDGYLGALEAHRHAVVGVLVGVSSAFCLKVAGVASLCRLALIPAGVEHQLDFFGKRVLVVYVEPHQTEYGALHRGLAGKCSIAPQLDPNWRAALRAWTQEQDLRPLVSRALLSYGEAAAKIDPRVREICRQFNENRLLDASTAQLAQCVHLSQSRLTHLLNDELGVGVRRLKQHYRFKVAAASVGQHASLTSGAHAAGFADSSHFSRAFLKTFGVTPSKVLGKSTRWI